VQNISITNHNNDLSAMIALMLGEEVTRCFVASADVSFIEVILEELVAIDSVDVVLDYEDSITRHFTVIFDGPVLSNGDMEEMQVDWASCANYTSNSAAVVAATEVVVNTVTNGAAHSVFEEFEVLTTAVDAAPITGYFESRYGFRGHMDKIAETVTLSPVNVLVVPGERTLIASTPVDHLIAPGVIMRIGDQEVMVDTVTDGNVSFIPYHIKGSLNDTLYVSDTLLGSSDYVLSSNTLNMGTDVTSELKVGDRIYVEGRVAGYPTSINDYYTVAGISVPGAPFVIIFDRNIGTAYDKVAVYRQQNFLVPFDATAEFFGSI
jgi:hypothetical protein